MGEAYKLDCDTCTYTRNIFVGFGFVYMSLESIASFVQDAALKRRIEEFIGNPSTRYDAYNALYVCPVCRAIRNELFIEMKSDSSQYRSSYALKATFYMDWD